MKTLKLGKKMLSIPIEKLASENPDIADQMGPRFMNRLARELRDTSRQQRPGTHYCAACGCYHPTSQKGKSNDHTTKIPILLADCSKLVKEKDCLERNLPERQWCESCRIYEADLRFEASLDVEALRGPVGERRREPRRKGSR